MATFTVEDFVLVVGILQDALKSLSEENKTLKKIVKDQEEEIERMYSVDR